ncbi:hypothetical protein GUITHDRAFT_161424, partial [Guillardia theta CCMP2712]
MEPSGLEAQDDSEVDIYLASEDELGSFMAEHDETLSVCDDFEPLRIAGEKISMAFADEPSRMYGELLRLCKEVVKALHETNHHEMSDAFKMLKMIAADAVQRAEQHLPPPLQEEEAAADPAASESPELRTSMQRELKPGSRRPRPQAPQAGGRPTGLFANLFSGFGWKQSIHGGRIGVRKVSPNPVLCDQLCSNGFSRADVLKVLVRVQNDATKALEILTGMYSTSSVDEELVSQMEKLGFGREDVALALKETQNEEVLALEILTDRDRIAALRAKEEQRRKLELFDEDEFEFVNLDTDADCKRS